jgi:transcriptional regulator with XRE-family HTH domain
VRSLDRYAVLRNNIRVTINGAHVKTLREKDGSTMSDFAKRVGISLGYLNDIESGRRTCKRNPAIVKRIAEALNVPMSMIERRAPGED